MRKRRRVEYTESREQLEPLCVYDGRIRPPILPGEPVLERAKTGTSGRTLNRRISGLEEDGMQSLLGSKPARRKGV